MKIKIWIFILIIVGSVFVGAAGGFAATGGFAFAGRLIEELRQPAQPNVGMQVPGGNNGNHNGNNNGKFDFGNMPDWSYDMMPSRPEGLPEDFNAGVSIAATYGGMTNRTEDQVNADALEAGASVWGLVQKEGKLDELKAKVTEAVTASLKQMVADGKITQAQSDGYLNWVEKYLQAIGRRQYRYGMMPGNGRGFRHGQPSAPGPTAAPGATTTPGTTIGTGV